MSMKVSVFDRLGVKKLKNKNKHKLIFKMRKRRRKTKFCMNYYCRGEYDNLSEDYDVAVKKYNMVFKSLQYPFINNLDNSRKTKPTSDSSETFAGLIISSLMVNQTICTLRKKANGPLTKLFQNATEKITITVLNERSTIIINTDEKGRTVTSINISNGVKNLIRDSESGKLEKHMKTNPPYMRKVIITTNESEKPANNHSPKKHSGFEDIKNSSDQNQLVKQSKYWQSNWQETEPFCFVGTTNKTENSRHTVEGQPHIKCEVESSSSDDEKASHPNRRLESEKPLESTTKRSPNLPSVKSLSFIGIKNQIQNFEHTEGGQTYIKCEVDSSSDDEKESRLNRRLESEKPSELKTKRSLNLHIMKPISFFGTKNQTQNSEHTGDDEKESCQNRRLESEKPLESNAKRSLNLHTMKSISFFDIKNQTQNPELTEGEQTHIKYEVGLDSSSDDETESYPNRRLESEKPLESKTKRRITSPIMKSKRMKLTVQKPGASYFWERVLKTPAFWKEEFHYSVAKSHENCSLVEKESELNFQTMLAQFQTFKVKQNQKANKITSQKRFKGSLTGCLADKVFTSPAKGCTALGNTTE